MDNSEYADCHLCQVRNFLNFKKELFCFLCNQGFIINSFLEFSLAPFLVGMGRLVIQLGRFYIEHIPQN